MEQLSSLVGDLINYRGFVYAPVNKMGVMMLFEAVIQDLHLQVEEVRPYLPHCLARRHTGHGWEPVALAFAYKSGDLRAQAPALQACGMIVCWAHDWPECPIIEVIELRAVSQDPGPIASGATGLLRLGTYVKSQPEPTQRLFRRLDQGVRALAPDIVVKVTKGRKSVGGVSYYAPEVRFCSIDLLPTGRGLTFSVFTGGQRWEGVRPSKSSPLGFFSVWSDADLPQALELAKAAYETVKRTLPQHGAVRPRYRRGG